MIGRIADMHVEASTTPIAVLIHAAKRRHSCTGYNRQVRLFHSANQELHVHTTDRTYMSRAPMMKSHSEAYIHTGTQGAAAEHMLHLCQHEGLTSSKKIGMP